MLLPRTPGSLAGAPTASSCLMPFRLPRPDLAGPRMSVTPPPLPQIFRRPVLSRFLSSSPSLLSPLTSPYLPSLAHFFSFHTRLDLRYPPITPTSSTTIGLHDAPFVSHAWSAPRAHPHAHRPHVAVVNPSIPSGRSAPPSHSLGQLPSRPPAKPHPSLCPSYSSSPSFTPNTLPTLHTNTTTAHHPRHALN